MEKRRNYISYMSIEKQLLGNRKYEQLYGNEKIKLGAQSRQETSILSLQTDLTKEAKTRGQIKN